MTFSWRVTHKNESQLNDFHSDTHQRRQPRVTWDNLRRFPLNAHKPPRAAPPPLGHANKRCGFVRHSVRANHCSCCVLSALVKVNQEVYTAGMDVHTHTRNVCMKWMRMVVSSEWVFTVCCVFFVVVVFARVTLVFLTAPRCSLAPRSLTQTLCFLLQFF